MEIWIYTILSVIIVSLFSFAGALTLSINAKKLEKILIYMISFAAGAMFGDAFIHLLPEVVDKSGFSLQISIYILLGIIFSFVIEKIIHWRHCHLPITHKHIHHVAWMNLFGDGFHNFIDGVIIGASYLVSVEVGIATTIAVILHEIPQEIADFGVLIHGGFTKAKALLINFITAITSVVGAIFTLLIIPYVENLTIILIPVAAGTFIYIAGADLLPELHKEVDIIKSLIQIAFFIMGVLIMVALKLIG